ncbi:MAG: YdiU family protein [Pseudanabaenaceae cyanobacterium bins.68]|nr:YdiU family protein [Pseudanabaenaceae cyanobacterium bins.68]
MNPFLQLDYQPEIEQTLGNDYYDQVAAAQFPTQILRWRNNQVLPILGLDPAQVTDQDFLEAFGEFKSVRPLLALRYHGYQFGEYNPRLGDGRGFLYGQVRGIEGQLYDLGTKGSGKTPYSRSADGCLTLKGGVREVLAAEALQRAGVNTSRCLSLIETGEQLWRGDEPSPTRSSVMVRFQRSHIRFGTFERLHFIGRSDLVEKLLNWVIATYYPELTAGSPPELHAIFYGELVRRVAILVAQWMSVGFCHAVLNTDNMTITAESFDYGPYGLIDTYNPKFTAAYFDYYGRYCYANQPAACQWNLQMLQVPLRMVIDSKDLEQGLDKFGNHYQAAYLDCMLNRLGLTGSLEIDPHSLVSKLLEFLYVSQINYHGFFQQLRQGLNPSWWQSPQAILPDLLDLSPEAIALLDQWRLIYHRALNTQSPEEWEKVAAKLKRHNPLMVLARPLIEAVWQQISEQDNWQPFYDLVENLRAA